MKKQISSLIMFIGFAVLVLGTILDALSAAKSGTASSSASTASLIAILSATPNIAAVFAVCLVNSEKNVTKNVGYALGGMTGAYGLVSFILALQAEESAFLLAPLGQSVMFVASLIYFLYVCISFFGFAKKDTTKKEAQDIYATLSSYKELEDGDVIDESEFDALKEAALADADKVAVKDLKRWKELLDKQVITEEDFTALKAKALPKRN